MMFTAENQLRWTVACIKQKSLIGKWSEQNTNFDSYWPISSFLQKVSVSHGDKPRTDLSTWLDFPQWGRYSRISTPSFESSRWPFQLSGQTLQRWHPYVIGRNGNHGTPAAPHVDPALNSALGQCCNRNWTVERHAQGHQLNQEIAIQFQIPAQVE